MWARALMLRGTRHLAVRQSLLDERLVAALASTAFDTSVSQRAASSFPPPLDPAAVSDIHTRIGELFVHADDEVMTPLLRAHGTWEASESAFLERSLRPGDTFVDVGANFGYFSVLGAALVGSAGRVIAVEPEARNVALLKANLWRNRATNAVVVPLAAGRGWGYVPLTFNECNRGDHQVGWRDRADRLVPCARLDDLLAGERVDFIKVDTQGVDHDVIAGLCGTFGSASPTILSEFWFTGMQERGIDPGSVAGEYRRLGFTLHLLQEDGSLHAVDSDGVVDAARTHPAGFVNVVLKREA